MTETANKNHPDTEYASGARFQYNVKNVTGGWVGRYVLLRVEDMTPVETHDPSAGKQILVFDTVADAERFKLGMAENAAELLQHSAGMTFEQALDFVKNESKDTLIIAAPESGVLSIDQGVYLVSF